MSDLQARFETATKEAVELPKAPDTKTMLEMYALYKQAKEGDVSGDRPGAFDFVGRSKYDAWAKLEGTSREDAMQNYIDIVERLKEDAA